jgi:isocitrate dehydrogenase (NAD+)
MNKVNPSAIILSAILMLKHIGETKTADRIEMSLKKVIRQGKRVTYDLGGNASTGEMAEEIVRMLDKE